MGSILFAVIFIQHGSICIAFLPDVREITIVFQRRICCLILYFECAGTCVGSGLIKPIGNTITF